MKPASRGSLTFVLQSAQVHLKDLVFQEAGVCHSCSCVPQVFCFPEGLALPQEKACIFTVFLPMELITLR